MMMRVIVEPTEELANIKVNGALVPARVWKGQTESGIEIEMFVLSIIPETKKVDTFVDELPGYFKRTIDVADIG